MILIDQGAWTEMTQHAMETYPNECCGAMLGSEASGVRRVTRAVRLANAARGPQGARYEIRPGDLLETDELARAEGLVHIGIYHSHPDADAYFSETDLKNSCPWFSFVVMSIRKGRFDHARSYRPDPDQSAAEPEPLTHPNGDSKPCPEF